MGRSIHNTLLRQGEILEIVNTSGRISIQEITDKYNISDPTAWRDLKALERAGKLKKVYGGAVRINEFDTKVDSFEVKLQQNLQEKKILANYAADMFIEDGDIIFLDGGSTIMSMIPFIKQRNITIITNGLYTLAKALQFINNKGFHNLTVISPGGVLQHNTATFAGPETEAFFEKYHADKFFTSGVGITIDRGITDPGLFETEVKQIMVKRAEKVIGIFDSSKIGNISMRSSLPIDTLDTLVIPENANEDFILNIEGKHTINLHKVPISKP